MGEHRSRALMKSAHAVLIDLSDFTSHGLVRFSACRSYLLCHHVIIIIRKIVV